MAAKDVGAESKTVVLVVPPGQRVGVEAWRGMMLGSARAVMAHLVRGGFIGAPVGMSVEMAERELMEMFASGDGRETASAVLTLLEPRDCDPDVMFLRMMVVVHRFRPEDVGRRAELLGLLDEASDEFRVSEWSAAWNRLVKFAQLWREVGGDSDVAYWAIAMGVIDWDACGACWTNAELDALDDDAWDVRHRELVTAALVKIGETDVQQGRGGARPAGGGRAGEALGAAVKGWDHYGSPWRRGERRGVQKGYCHR